MSEKKETKFDFSQYSLYKKCPQSYRWRYIDRKTPQKPPNMYYAFPGIIIQKIFEHFYNDEWFLKRGACREYMYNKAPEIFEKTLKWCYVDWHSDIAKKTKHQVYDEFLEMIGKNLEVIKEYQLLGNLAKSEHKIITYFEKNHYVRLTSKIDFFMKTKDGLIILDGKATSNKKTYLDDPAQLYFYAMMSKFKYNTYPDKIGYWWWRDAKISYVDYDLEKIENLKEDMKEVLYKIYKEKFDATPEYKACMFCNYQDECYERKKHIADKRAEKYGVITKDDLKMFE